MEDNTEQFVRRQNIDRYRGLLGQTKDEARRQRLLALLADEERKQREAADPIVMNLEMATAIHVVLGRSPHH